MTGPGGAAWSPRRRTALAIGHGNSARRRDGDPAGPANRHVARATAPGRRRAAAQASPARVIWRGLRGGLSCHACPGGRPAAPGSGIIGVGCDVPAGTRMAYARPIVTLMVLAERDLVFIPLALAMHCHLSSH